MMKRREEGKGEGGRSSEQEREQKRARGRRLIAILFRQGLSWVGGGGCRHWRRMGVGCESKWVRGQEGMWVVIGG